MMMATNICKGMFGVNGIMPGFYEVFTRLSAARTFGIIGCCLVLHGMMRNITLEDAVKKIPSPILALVLGVMVVVVFLTLFGEDHAFLYFQF